MKDDYLCMAEFAKVNEFRTKRKQRSFLQFWRIKAGENEPMFNFSAGNRCLSVDLPSDRVKWRRAKLSTRAFIRRIKC